MIRPDFCVAILSHGRASQVLTLRELRRSGYTGPILLVLDDEDGTRPEYEATFGAREDRGDFVRVFCKRDVDVDVGDNDLSRRGVVYARNAVFDVVAKRKVMNSFICAVDRVFRFNGRLNEDVNTYVLETLRGAVMLTIPSVQLNQLMTQSNADGMTAIYQDVGTYAKSFYSVMHAPACVRISELKDPRSPHARVHHEVDWSKTAPLVLREDLQKR